MKPFEIDKWGLVGIYKTRQLMNLSCDIVLETANKHLDIIAWGLKSFRDSKGELIKEKVKQGLKIRILTCEPASKYVKEREMAEQEFPGEIKETILALHKWVYDLYKISPDKNNVQIKFYNHLPLDFYFRVDDHVFIGPYLFGLSSQQTITYEFKGNSKGFRYYNDNFERLWENPPNINEMHQKNN